MMRAALLLLLLACGGAPCEPVQCEVPATPNVCACGARFCTVCFEGEVHNIDCADRRLLDAVCVVDGGSP